ncbi:InlB B-repeat-containing protein [Bifidobacterium sp. ESL0732]|uniref:InlB B-repeat-containing protein n=1 Tax=Bifidobacterium sp. ESL0732 TaxID=2983222 RepID=UPI0023F86DC7|nr:InlB B-repeat-containing protein [Bifidobacterium sp. ESL0732]WEV64250.1 InlB B-repeat-containing protein [Bifidobacterium sp. ESL0732]
MRLKGTKLLGAVVASAMLVGLVGVSASAQGEVSEGAASSQSQKMAIGPQAYATYTVRYDLANGQVPVGHSADYADHYVDPGNGSDGSGNMIAPAAPTRTGYDFAGWSVYPYGGSQPTGHANAGDTVAIAQDSVLKANWTVHHDPEPSNPGSGSGGSGNGNGGQGSGNGNGGNHGSYCESHPNSKECVNQNTPIDDGGGSEGSGNYVSINPIGSWDETIPESERCYINFYISREDQTIYSGIEMVRCGAKATPPNNSELHLGPDDEFDGWYQDDTKFDFDKPITERNTTIEGHVKHWQTYKLVYDFSGAGSDLMTNKDAFINQSQRVTSKTATFKVPTTVPDRSDANANPNYTWKFSRWRVIGATDNLADPGDTVTVASKNFDTITLIPNWTKSYNYQLSYDFNLGNSGDTVTNVNAFEPQKSRDAATWHWFTLRNADPQRKTADPDSNYSWKFLGWSTEKSASDDASSYLHKGGSLKLTYRKPQVTLYAQWQRYYTYRLSFDSNVPTSAGDAQTSPVEVPKVQSNGIINSRVMRLDGSEKLSLDGYKFLGWSKTAGSRTIDFEPGATGDIYLDPDNVHEVLHAVWVRERTHTLKLDYNAGGDASLQASCSKDADGDPVAGGEGCSLPKTDTSVTDTKDSADIKVPQSGLMRDGATFVGWTMNADGTGATYEPGDTVPVGADGAEIDEANAPDSSVTLYAQWVPKTAYSVSFAPGVGHVTHGFDTLTAISAHNSKKFVIPVANHYGDDENSTHRFIEWKDEATGKTYKPGDAVTVSSADRNVVLTAQWDNLYSYQLSFDMNAGNSTVSPVKVASMSKTTTDESHRFEMPNVLPTRSGDSKVTWRFIGWNSARDGSGDSPVAGLGGESSLTLQSADPVAVLYAQWAKVTVPSSQIPSTSSTVVKPASPLSPLAPVVTPVSPSVVVPQSAGSTVTQPSASARDRSISKSDSASPAKPRVYCLADGQSEVSGSAYTLTPAGYMVQAAGNIGRCSPETMASSYAGTRAHSLWWLLLMVFMMMIFVVLIVHRNRFIYAQHRSEEERR